MSEALVRLTQVEKIYRTAKTTDPVQAVAPTDLTIADGEFVSLVGPSGCGKTTLLMMVAGLVPPTAGEIRVGAEVIDSPRHDAGLVFQKPVLLPWLSVESNVLLPSAIAGDVDAGAKSRAKHLIEMVGLRDFAGNLPDELSGGMQQRASIARSLLRNPRILLMDEPFGALDALTRENLNMELSRIWDREKKAVLFVTHSISEAVFLSDKVVVMTAHPGTVKAEIPIPIPHPRTPDLIETHEFQSHVKNIRRLLDEGAGADLRTPEQTAKGNTP